MTCDSCLRRYPEGASAYAIVLGDLKGDNIREYRICGYCRFSLQNLRDSCLSLREGIILSFRSAVTYADDLLVSTNPVENGMKK